MTKGITDERSRSNTIIKLNVFLNDLFCLVDKLEALQLVYLK